MFNGQLKRAGTLALAMALALAGCKGEKGDAGPQGSTGPNGNNGVSTGIIRGVLTYKVGTTVFPATNVTVSTLPDAGVTDVTDATGNYELSVPIGFYSVKFSGNAFASMQVDGVSVASGLAQTVNRELTANNPLVVTAVTNIPNPAGFGASITLGVNVSGGTAPYTYTWTPRAANPTAVTLSDAAVAAPTFTTGTLKAVLESNKVVGLQPASLLRAGFFGVSVQQLAQMTYNFDCKVKDAQGFEKTVTVAVVPGTLAQGNGIVPRSTLVAGFFPGNAAALTFTKPAASSATLNDANGEFPWFVPDAPGTYQVGSLSVVAGNYTTAQRDCGGCHTTAIQASADAKFKAWNNSAHGNHFFKFMEYDGDNLVFKADVKAVPTVVDTVMWAVTPAAGSNLEPARAMTTFEFGFTGGEGTHYNFSSCVGCHTVGFNVANGVVNNGLDDKVKELGYSWPNLNTAFTGLISNAAKTDNATPAPQSAAWNAMPAGLRAYAGMQCESCHGPLSQHLVAGTPRPKPVGEYDVAACAICHDRPTNHDRVALWRQAGHANLQTAIDEAGIDKHTSGVDSCGRCHAAQGFVQYVAQRGTACTSFLDASGAAVTDPALVAAMKAGPLVMRQANGVCQAVGTANRAAGNAYAASIGLHSTTVQPITCAACHDAHSTSIRVSGNTGVLPAGFQVNGAGSGALCMVCHNTRNGARGDAWGDATKGAPIQNGAAVTAIGGPHEANQADQLAGSNAYWMPEFTPSAHLAVSETCVGCHMILHPDSVSRNGVVGVTNTNHTFKADGTICKHCHGEEVNGEALHAQFTSAFVGTKGAILAAGKTQILAGAQFAIKTSAKTGKTARTNVVVDQAVTTVTVTSFNNGRSPSFTLEFNPAIPDPGDDTAGVTTTTATVPLANFWAAPGGVVSATPMFDVLFGRIAKANWNLTLVGPGDPDPTKDGPKAGKNVFHNPKFMFQVLAVTKANVGDASKGSL